jgi:hypothetical protein
MSALDSARKKFMGPVEEITEDSVRFERLKPKPKPIKEGTKCWALGTILEPNTNIEAPCANGKTNEGEREYHAIVHDVVVVRGVDQPVRSDADDDKTGVHQPGDGGYRSGTGRNSGSPTIQIRKAWRCSARMRRKLRLPCSAM